MANDIAKLGFSADTSDLKKAKADLNALVPPAERVEKAAKKTGDALSGMGSKADAAAAGLHDIKGAAGAAAAGTAAVGVAADKAAGASNRVATGADNAARAIKRAGDEAVGATGKLARLGRAANDNLNAVQATPANIAAQFQDIGVTAAAGMNPMLIALQQGTQLSVAFANGFSGIGAALKQIFSPVALFTIGMVGIVAALIQMVDWIAVGKVALYGLANALDVAAPYAVALAAGLALINAPAILTGIVALTRGVWALAAGMLAAVGIPTLIVAGLVAIVAAANYFREELTQIIGFDVVKAAADGINAVVGFFVGGYNGIVKTWRMLPAAFADIVIQATNSVVRGTENMINASIDGINSLLSALPEWMKIGSGQIGRISLGQDTNANAGAAAKVGSMFKGEMSKAQGVDYVGKGVKFIQDGAKYLSGKLRGIADGLGAEEKDKKGGADKASSGKTDIEKFAEVMKDADKRIAALNAETAAIGLYGEALFSAKAKADLMEMAAQKDLKLSKEQIKLLDEKAQKIGQITALNQKLAFVEDLRMTGAQRVADLKAEQAALGLFGADLRRVQLEYQMLSDARRKNIDLAPEEIARVREMAGEQAALEEAIRRQREAIDFGRNTTRGFFRDFVEGARNGEGAWGAFTSAFDNFMDRIIDKLLNEVLDAIFQVNGAVSGGGGLLGTLGQLFGVFSGSGGLPTALQSQNAALDSLSGSFTGFARGGAFTNSVVSRPTAFAFGRGGANLGIMGEAGDEAILPLQRGPDGSLGVQMYGGRQQGASMQEVVVKVTTDDERFDAYVDTRIATSAPEIAQMGSAITQREQSFRQGRRLNNR